ncbi:hypothetical protein J6590_086948 [Homalodisca vitripennis]|nr:hypothetical protein J6590_086948 [Homalodisca vitripennis]
MDKIDDDGTQKTVREAPGYCNRSVRPLIFDVRAFLRNNPLYFFVVEGIQGVQKVHLVYCKYLLEFPTKKPWCMEWLEVLTQWTVLGRQSEWRRDRVDNYRQIYLKVLKKFEA